MPRTGRVRTLTSAVAASAVLALAVGCASDAALGREADASFPDVEDGGAPNQPLHPYPTGPVIEPREPIDNEEVGVIQMDLTDP